MPGSSWGRREKNPEGRQKREEGSNFKSKAKCKFQNVKCKVKDRSDAGCRILDKNEKRYWMVDRNVAGCKLYGYFRNPAYGLFLPSSRFHLN
jgi:hypothetical protein